MSKKSKATRRPRHKNGHSELLLRALNTAAAALQESDSSEHQVLRVAREQIATLNLRGAISLLDETGTHLSIRATAQPSRFQTVLAQVQQLLNLSVEGYTFPVAQVEVYDQVVQTGKAVFVPDTAVVLAQLLPEAAKPFRAILQKGFGSPAGIYAPLISDNQVRGVLNLTGFDLTVADLPAAQAFADHIAVALENARLSAAKIASEERFRVLIEQAYDLIAILHTDGTIRYASPAIEPAIQYTPAELIGTSIFDLAHPDDIPLIKSALDHRAAHRGASDTTIEARVRAKDGQWCWLEATGNNLFDNPAVRGIVLTCRDITARKLAEATVQKRDAILQAVSFAAGLFLKQPAWDHDIQEVLARFGNATGVSRVYIFENFINATGALNMRQRYEWKARGITPQIDNSDLQASPYDTIARRWAEKMARGELIFGNVRDFPQSEREVLQAQDIQSLVAVPIMVAETWWGFIGFDDCANEREWSSTERDALKTAAGILGEAIQRQRAEDALRARDHYLILLNEITRVGIGATDLQEMVQLFADRVGDLLNADGCHITFWDAAHQRVIPAADYGNWRAMVNAVRPEPGEPTLTEAVLRAGHSIAVEDVCDSPYISPRIAAQFPARALLGLPLIIGTQKIGAALISFNQPHGFTADEIARGEQAAGQIALAIAKMQSLEAERARVAELEAVRQATITLTARLDLRQVLDAILESTFQLAESAKDAHIFLYANDRLTFGAARWATGQTNQAFSIPREDGLTYTVARTGELIIVNDMTRHPLFTHTPANWAGAIIGLPIKIGKRVVGVMNLAYAQPYEFPEAQLRVLGLLADHAAIAIENARLFESEKQRVAELEVIRQAGITLTASLDLQTVLNTILENAMRLVNPANDMHVFLYENDRLTFGAARLADGSTASPWSVPREGGITYTVARTGQALIIPKTSDHPLYAGSSADWGGAIISLPLKARDRVVGVMNVAYWQPRKFSDAEVRMLELLSDQAAIAIENARLFKAERAARDQAETLRQAAQAVNSTLQLDQILRLILDQLKQIIVYDTASVFLFNDQGAPALIAGAGYADEISTSRVATELLEPGPILERMRQDQQPVIIPDVREYRDWIWVPGTEHVRSFLGVPIITQERVIGVLMMDNHQTDAYHETDAHLAQMLAQQLAIAIENARLFEAERQRRQETENIQEATTALTGTLDVHQVLDNILIHLNQVVPYDSACVFFRSAEHLRVVAARGLPDPDQVIGHDFEVNSNALHLQIEHTMRPVILADARADLRFAGYGGTTYVRGWMGVPLIVRGQVIGQLTLDNREVNAYDEHDAAIAQAFANQAAIALHNARLFDETERRARESEALYETARDLSMQHDVHPILQTIVERAAKLLNATGGSVHLYHSERGDLEIALSTDPTIQLGTRLQMGEGMAGKVAQTRKPLIVNNYTEWEGRSLQFANLPRLALVQAPMLYGGELIGVLSARRGGNDMREFTESDAYLLSLFAAQAASAVHTARLIEQTRLRADQLTRLYDAGLTLNRVLDPREQLEFLLKTAMQALRAEYAQFFRWDVTHSTLRYEWGIGHSRAIEDTLRATDFPTRGEHSIAGWVTQNRIPLYVPNVAYDARYVAVDPAIQSGLWVPIEHEDEPRGVLAVLSTRLDAFTPHDERLLTLFANQVAVAMENARLFEETHRHLAELQAVNRISIALRAAQTVEDMLPKLVREAAEILGGAHASIWLYDRATNELHQAAQHNFHPIATPLKPGEGIAGYVLATGDPYVSRDFKNDPRIDERARVQEPAGLGGVCVPVRTVDETIGVLFASVEHPREITDSEIRLATTIAEIAGNAIHRMRLNDQTRHLVTTLSLAYDETIEGWARALDLRDRETQGHTRRVVETTLKLARALNVPELELQSIRWGALLHDIGKMGIPDAILLKAGPLSDAEWEIMHLHPAYAHRLLAPIEYLRDALDIPYNHHEKWDGTGYPRGLKSDQIPLAARIFAVVDVWDALCSDRPYRAAWPKTRAREYLREQAGAHFDPRVVAAFRELENGSE